MDRRHCVLNVKQNKQGKIVYTLRDNDSITGTFLMKELFLGGKESSTLKEISETLGKETIDLYNTSDTRGQSPSFGTTYQKTGKDVP